MGIVTAPPGGFAAKIHGIYRRQIEEVRRLAQQAEAQVTAQVEMIDRMKRSGLSTAVAEEALRMMRKLHADLMTRLNGMRGVKG